MQSWWNVLDILGKIFALIAIPSTLLLVIHTVFSVLGIGIKNNRTSDEGSDNENAGTTNDLRIVSFKAIVSFLAVFGWLGIELLKLGAGNTIVVVVGTCAGFIIMLIMAILLCMLVKMNTDGKNDIKISVGTSAVVCKSIPQNKSGRGAVCVDIDGKKRKYSAITEDVAELSVGADTVVVGTEGKNTLLVARK